MIQSTSIFIRHAENNDYLRKRTGKPAKLGITPYKSAVAISVIGIIPVSALLVGVGIYLRGSTEDLTPLLSLLLIASTIFAILFVMVMIYFLVNEFIKKAKLEKSGQLVRGTVQSVEFTKEYVGDDDDDFFYILKLRYEFISPQSTKIITGKIHQRYMPEKANLDLVFFEGKPCAIYYASDRYHVVL